MSWFAPKEKSPPVNVRSNFPIVWFLGDGFYVMIRRMFLDDEGKNWILLVNPEPRVRLRYPDINAEVMRKGFATLEFPKEFIKLLNPDPAGPRYLALTDIKGKVQDVVHKHLMDTVLSQKDQIMNLTVRHIVKDSNYRGLLEDFEGEVDKYQRLKKAFGVKDESQSSDFQARAEDYGGG